MQNFEEMDKTSELITGLGKLDNKDFVSFIRATRTEAPFVWNYVFWSKAVDREIKMRLLLQIDHKSEKIHFSLGDAVFAFLSNKS